MAAECPDRGEPASSRHRPPGRWDDEDSRTSATRLVLEVTEGMLEADAPAAFEALTALRADGVRIAVDDFGTGHSSLSHIRPPHWQPMDATPAKAGFMAVPAPCRL